MYKIGLSTCGKKELLGNAFLDECKSNNIEYIEISCNSDMIFSFDYESFISYAKKLGITVWSFHLPFCNIDISVLDDELRKKAIDYFETIIKKFSGYGIHRFIIHPSSEPIDNEIRVQRLNASKKSLTELADIAENYNSVLSVENLPRTCLGKNSDEMLELLSADERLSVSFDTNHLLEESQVDFISKIGNKIETLHVSDYDFVNERHWLPGEGKTDWSSVVSTLLKVGYKGPWLYEILFQCPKTIIRNRDLKCKDFEINANEIFNGRPLSTFSKHKENLGMWE